MAASLAKHCRYTLCRYSVVCKIWTNVCEYHIWQDLVLDQARLAPLQFLMERNPLRRNYVRRIWFRTKLDAYDCSVCQLPEDLATYLR